MTNTSNKIKLITGSGDISKHICDDLEYARALRLEEIRTLEFHLNKPSTLYRDTITRLYEQRYKDIKKELVGLSPAELLKTSAAYKHLLQQCRNTFAHIMEYCEAGCPFVDIVLEDLDTETISDLTPLYAINNLRIDIMADKFKQLGAQVEELKKILSDTKPKYKMEKSDLVSAEVPAEVTAEKPTITLSETINAVYGAAIVGEKCASGIINILYEISTELLK